jgi:2-polyprenyl-6-methoxyphenol hydroxylase-like FAD-dependent oxidoreductase
MSDFDVIVVGARVGGAVTARSLAERGHRVLLIDQARFPSDTVSTHLIHPPGMAALARWGLADAVLESGTPPVTHYRLDLGPIVITGRPRGLPTARHAFAPRRITLDAILVDAARHAGVEVREGVTMTDVLVDDGVVRGIRCRTRAGTCQERARVVVGADGVRSSVAAAVGAEVYHEVPAMSVLYYAYWSGLAREGSFDLINRGRRGFGLIPTSEGLTVVAVAWPMDEFEANRHDIRANYLKAFEADPERFAPLRDARLESRISGATMPNRYRRSFGPGWALVGDAAYVKDATTAQGISDAFTDAESLAAAIHDVLCGKATFMEALGAHERARLERTRPMFDFTLKFSTFDPPADEDVALLAAVAADPAASDDFASVMAGTLPVETFFDPANLERLVGRAAA